MIVTIQREITTEVIKAIVCNRCHKEIFPEVDPVSEMIHVRYTGGFNSTFPGDGKKLECDLCESCFQELLEEFCVIVE